MKRRWGRILQVVLASSGRPLSWGLGRLAVQPDRSSVQVKQFLRTPLKGQKEEFDYMGTVDQPCVRSLFPHSSESPCWWLARHKIQWVSP